MNIPPKADKWIVLISILALALLDYFGSYGIHFVSIQWLLDTVLIAVLLTTVYVIWCVLCRWLARRLRKDPNSGHVRIVSNTTFFALLMSTIFLLVPPTYTARGRILMPASPARPPDMRSNQSMN